MIAENHWPYKYESVKQGKMNITHRNIKKLIETDIMNKSKCLYHELLIIFFGYLRGEKIVYHHYNWHSLWQTIMAKKQLTTDEYRSPHRVTN